MYLQDYLKLEAEKLALLPLIMFVSSFGMSLLNKPMNMKLGRKVSIMFCLNDRTQITIHYKIYFYNE